MSLNLTNKLVWIVETIYKARKICSRSPVAFCHRHHLLS